MSTNVDRTGTFRAEVVDSGLGETRKAGYPQFNVNAKLIEYYDENIEKWVDWSEYGQDVDCRLYLVGLVGKKKELGTTLTYDQVCKVFDWDGADLQELADPKVGVKFQVRIKDNDPEYADRAPFVVNWIDAYDAEPKRTVTKCTPEEIKGLQAKYAALLKAKAKPAAPAKAPAKTATQVVEEANLQKVTEPGVITKKKKAPSVPSPTLSSPPPSKRVDNFTKTDAWRAIVELKIDSVTDKQLGEVWQKAIDDVSNRQGEDVLNGEGWWKVKDRVLDKVGKF